MVSCKVIVFTIEHDGVQLVTRVCSTVKCCASVQLLLVLYPVRCHLFVFKNMKNVILFTVLWKKKRRVSSGIY